MKKINLSVLVSSLTIGGAEQLLLALVRHLDRRKFNIQLLFLRSPDLLGRELIHLVGNSKTRLIRCQWDPLGPFRVAAALRAHQTDAILLLDHLNSLCYGGIAAKLARVPVIINWEHDSLKGDCLHPLTLFGRRLCHLGIDKIVAVANGHREIITGREKLPRRKISVIYNGVNPDEFCSPLSPGQARSKLGIPQDSRVVSIIAALRPEKAHGIFLRAAHNVLAEIPDTHFLIVGDGPQRAQLENLSGRLGIEHRVWFLGFRRDIADILAAVDVNTLSSEQEVLSVAILESMAAGIPSVCPRVGFMDEVVIPGKTGYLFSPGNAEDLAAKLIRLLNDGGRLQIMGATAQGLVREKMSIFQMAMQFEGLIESTITRKLRGPRR